MKYNLPDLFKRYQVTGISFDSRLVKRGDVFFAIKGEKFDGNQFIEEAFKSGAVLAFTDREEYSNSLVLYAHNIREVLADAAGLFYPKLPQYVIAVTGTNGKSSVVSYCQQIISRLGKNAACLGTLGVECSDLQIQKLFNEEKYQALTTADIITLRQVLHNLATNNINYVAFEASSHGIDQGRMLGIKAISAGLTSFSQDHLDYHQTMDEYLKAKLKLFLENLIPNSIAVINKDIQEFKIIQDYLNENSISYITVGSNRLSSKLTSMDVTIEETKQSIFGQKIIFSHLGKNYHYSTEIIGSYQASNMLIAAMLVYHTGFNFDDIYQTLPKLKAVRGRLQRVTESKSSFHIFVDYAHTPGALENSLKELRKMKQAGSNLKVIFGCGGNRDSTKRSKMGEVAERYADFIVITDDNPRNEDAGHIRKEILAGCASDRTIEIAGRKEAIYEIVTGLEDGDILLVAGKGHENYQIIGDKRIFFDDVVMVAQALKERR